jgi:3-methylcrotonyl-CoA carboxylase alpha subunit
MIDVSKHKVLIANRGEIACRVIRSCRSLGIATVAVYSDADQESMHVQLADEAIHIGAAKAAESYLDVQKVLQAITVSGATAVHPGYGFLSENTDFARQIMAAGVRWIGPAPDTISEMGDKDRARQLAQSAGVPVLPGSQRFATGELDGIEEAGSEVGYPLLVKASAGGGGIGMRLVESAPQLLDIAASTQSMAERSFGDGTVFLERYVKNARHIEVQVFGDGKGEAIHLYERECSIQRRFQKVVEESPAPGLKETLRRQIAECAVNLARSQNYAGAGTVEFVFDDDSNEYFFLEMNTRVQVEHPVTEMVTHTDIVAMQICLALEDDSLTLDQSQIAHRGAAIECRIYAEDPDKMFLPSPGLLEVLTFPQEGEDVRVDTGVRQGDRVTPYYDPMIAKIIVRAPDRSRAIDAMANALKETRIEGPRCNERFLLNVMNHPQYREGKVTTRFIDDNLQALTRNAIEEPVV